MQKRLVLRNAVRSCRPFHTCGNPVITDKAGATLLFITLDCAAVSGSASMTCRICVCAWSALRARVWVCAGAATARSLEFVQRLHLYNDNRSEMYHSDIYLIDTLISVIIKKYVLSIETIITNLDSTFRICFHIGL